MRLRGIRAAYAGEGRGLGPSGNVHGCVRRGNLGVGFTNNTVAAVPFCCIEAAVRAFAWPAEDGTHGVSLVRTVCDGNERPVNLEPAPCRAVSFSVRLKRLL